MEKEAKKPNITGNAVIACLVAIALIACIQIAATYLNLESFIKRETAYPSIETGIQSSVEQLTFAIDKEIEKDRKAALADTYFKALSLRDKVNDDGFLNNSVEDYGNSFAVKVEGDRVIFPDGAESIPELTADVLKGEHGIIDTSAGDDWRSFAAFSRIDNDHYTV
ncbi:MAG: hypothetical protein IKF42_02240, partial [Mogibacterium sp.]|nr:hypothetical protein [Mogibacterium sp.]